VELERAGDIPVKQKKRQVYPGGIKNENRFHWAGRTGG